MILIVTQNQLFFANMVQRLRKAGKMSAGIFSLQDLWVKVRDQRPKIIILDVSDS
jgi:hypothetical protein